MVSNCKLQKYIHCSHRGMFEQVWWVLMLNENLCFNLSFSCFSLPLMPDVLSKRNGNKNSPWSFQHSISIHYSDQVHCPSEFLKPPTQTDEDGHRVIRKSLVVWSGTLARVADGSDTADLQADKALVQEFMSVITLKHFPVWLNSVQSTAQTEDSRGMAVFVIPSMCCSCVSKIMYIYIVDF